MPFYLVFRIEFYNNQNIEILIWKRCVCSYGDFFALRASKYIPRPFWTFGWFAKSKKFCRSASRLFSKSEISFPRRFLLVMARASGETLANCIMNCSHRLIASCLSLATSSIRPIFAASSVVNIAPKVSAFSASRIDITLRIEAWNHNGATIPKRVSFKPIVNLGHMTRYSQLNANKHPPAGEWPYFFRYWFAIIYDLLCFSSKWVWKFKIRIE